MTVVSGPWLVWLVVGAVFGFLFFIACVVSVVKAVRDRQQIKARNKVKRAAMTNGQIPENNCAGCNRKLNLILIHDVEKERRVKRAERKRGSVSTTSFSITSPGSLSSPGNLSSGRTEITTTVEMAGQPISCISGRVVEHDVRLNSQMLSDAGSCVLENHSPFTGIDEISVDLGTEAIAFRRSSITSSGTATASTNGGLISAFPVPLSSVVDKVPFSDHCGNGDAFRVKAYRSGNGLNLNDKVSPRSPVVPGKSLYRQCSATGLSSSPGCTNTLSTKSSLYCTACEKQLNNTDMGPRRNSCVPDLSSHMRIDPPPRRRHSDECRHVISSSLSRLCQNAVRSRRFRRDGADNPAYETLDDEGSM